MNLKKNIKSSFHEIWKNKILIETWKHRNKIFNEIQNHKI